MSISNNLLFEEIDGSNLIVLLAFIQQNQMKSQFPVETNQLFKKSHHKLSSNYYYSSSLNSSPNHQQKFEHQYMPNLNLYPVRPSSFSNAHKTNQNSFLSSSQELRKSIKVDYDSIMEGDSSEDKNWHYQKFKPNRNKQKYSLGKDVHTNQRTTKSLQKKAASGSIFASTLESQQPKKELSRFYEKKEKVRSKIPSFIKKSVSSSQNANQLNLPLDNMKQNKIREVKTDRDNSDQNMLVLPPNMSVPKHLEFLTQLPDVKQRKQDKILKNELQTTQNSKKNVLRQPKQDSVNIVRRNMKKHMTKDFTLQVSSFPLEQREINLPNFQPDHITRKQREDRSVHQSDQHKSKKNFEFFRNIKKRKLTCLLQQPPRQFQLGDFLFIDKLGKGAFGDVFIAQQKNSGFICVIKKLSKKKIKEQKLEQQLYRQIKIQSYLNHRHITSLYGFFDDQTHIYLILELLPDGSLMQAKKRNINQKQVSKYIRQISLGLKYLHTQKVIHRDIKPQNIFLHEGYAKIGDFGCSVYTSTFRNSQIGSLAYVSPEQLKHQFYNQKIDVWSLGIMAYEMLLGSSPFEKDILKIARKQMDPELLELRIPEGVVLSKQAKQFLMGVLNNDPKARLGIQQVLKHDFITKYSQQENINQQQIT